LEAQGEGPDLSRCGHFRVRRVRGLCRHAEKGLTMIVGLIYAAAALAIAVYMVVALLRPDKF
jgi:hypothetical protein